MHPAYSLDIQRSNAISPVRRTEENRILAREIAEELLDLCDLDPDEVVRAVNAAWLAAGDRDGIVKLAATEDTDR